MPRVQPSPSQVASTAEPAKPPRSGSKAARAEATRAHLIDTAIGLLHERSYQGTTVFEVAKAAGVTHGALQHHFGSKAVMMMQVTDGILRASGPDGVAWPDARQALDARCRELVEALWVRVYEPPRFLAAWAVYFGSAGEPELRSHIARQRRELSATLHQRFMQALPELRSVADSPAWVQLVLSALRGLAITRLFGADATGEQAQLQQLAHMIEVRCREATASPPGATVMPPEPSPRPRRTPP